MATHSKRGDLPRSFGDFADGAIRGLRDIERCAVTANSFRFTEPGAIPNTIAPPRFTGESSNCSDVSRPQIDLAKRVAVAVRHIETRAVAPNSRWSVEASAHTEAVGIHPLPAGNCGNSAVVNIDDSNASAVTNVKRVAHPPD